MQCILDFINNFYRIYNVPHFNSRKYYLFENMQRKKAMTWQLVKINYQDPMKKLFLIGLGFQLYRGGQF